MSFSAKVLRVLIASPSDLGEERSEAAQAVYEWNVDHAEINGLVLLPVMFETHATPEAADRAQEPINRDLVDTSDILVGLFWTRLGSPTGVADSGTIEEIDRFRAAGKSVMLYFSDRKVRPTQVDTSQLQKLEQFKKQTLEHDLAGTFSSPIELRRLLVQHLTRVVKSLKDSGLNGPQLTRVFGKGLDEGRLRLVLPALVVRAECKPTSGTKLFTKHPAATPRYVRGGVDVVVGDHGDVIYSGNDISAALHVAGFLGKLGCAADFIDDTHDDIPNWKNHNGFVSFGNYTSWVSHLIETHLGRARFETCNVGGVLGGTEFRVYGNSYPDPHNPVHSDSFLRWAYVVCLRSPTHPHASLVSCAGTGRDGTKATALYLIEKWSVFSRQLTRCDHAIGVVGFERGVPGEFLEEHMFP